MKIAVQITDIDLNPGINAPPYCIGRDRGGRVYSPIWFSDTSIPAQFSLYWIEPHGRKWMLGSPLIGQTSLDGLGIGDKKISVENLWLIANDTIHISAGNNDSIDVHDTRIRNVPIPTEDDEAANKEYVDLISVEAALPGGGLNTVATADDANMAVNTIYIPTDDATRTVFTLPDTAAVGSILKVVGEGNAGWKIAQNAGETIRFGTANSTTGAGGYIESTDKGDCVELVCVVADTDWRVASAVGNITYA
jgi:hypothetical protein